MPKTNNGSEEKLWAAASYLPFISLVALAARKGNPYIKFHASQGLLLFVLFIIFGIIPVLGWLLNILVVIAMVVGAIKALGGTKWTLPVLAGAAQSLGDWVVKTLKL